MPRRPRRPAGRDVAGGSVVVALVSERHPLASLDLAEVLETSDVPGGVRNILTGHATELGAALAPHVDVDALDVTGWPPSCAPSSSAWLPRTSSGWSAGGRPSQSLWEIEPLLEMKTVWHPVGVSCQRSRHAV